MIQKVRELWCLMIYYTYVMYVDQSLLLLISSYDLAGMKLLYVCTYAHFLISIYIRKCSLVHNLIPCFLSYFCGCLCSLAAGHTHPPSTALSSLSKTSNFNYLAVNLVHTYYANYKIILFVVQIWRGCYKASVSILIISN